jgi:hypothetical protein
LAFAVGLAVAWVRGWSTTDLIWSLWLSSLVVGYALIVWAVAQPALELLGLGWRNRAEVERRQRGEIRCSGCSFLGSRSRTRCSI